MRFQATVRQVDGGPAGRSSRTADGAMPPSATWKRSADSSVVTGDASASSRPAAVDAAPTPAVAVQFFTKRLALVERYVSWLAGPGLERGLIGPRELPRLWERHVLNCAVVKDAVPVGATVADIGSGAGLPGLVLAIVRPDVRMTLVEPLQRRSSFLDEVVVDLGLTNVDVVRARAEDLADTVTVDVVTARAVARLERLTRWTLPLLSTGGRLLALKGDSAVEEVAEAADTLARMGAVSCTIREFGHGIVQPPTRVVVVEVGPRVREAVPRRRRRKGAR
jgi:16S rRNA (guanine527-N7)-methyltransferase